MNEYVGLQLVAHIVHTMLYTIYILHFEPYIEKRDNMIRVWNEVSVLLVSFVLIGMSSDFIEIDTKYNLGFVYILFASTNFVYNLYGIIYELIT